MNRSDFNQPIILLTVPRSGSSMVSGIFHAHGVWCGPTRPGDKHNPHGYFESIPLNKAVHRYTRYATFPTVDQYDFGWKEKVQTILAQNGYKSGPWFMKHSARHFSLWNDFQPRFVCIRRKEDSIHASWKRIRREKNTSVSIRKDLEAMKYIEENVPHVSIHSDELVAGNYRSLREAFEYCDLEFDERLAKQKIDPACWHHR